jgi:uncharacterized protein YdhG (YjbR/CyaY superfamily)
MKTYHNIANYIQQQPTAVQPLLWQMQQTISKAAPGAAEAIKYGMPTFVLQGNLVHFAACKTHIGFYPSPSGIIAFKTQLIGYTCSKGAIQFPFGKPLPLALIAKIVKYRAKENNIKAAKK